MAKDAERTRDEYFTAGKEHYEAAIALRQQEAEANQVNEAGKLAVRELWIALSFGDIEAPYFLSKCFEEGVGVNVDPYRAKLLKEVASKVGSVNYHTESKKGEEIPPEMEAPIDILVQLILEELNKNNSDQVITDASVTFQLEKFNEAISLPGGRTMEGLLQGHSYPADSTSEEPSEGWAELAGATTKDICCCDLF